MLIFFILFLINLNKVSLLARTNFLFISTYPLMISSIGFIPNSTEITKLKKFVPDEQIKSRLSNISIPLVFDVLDEEDTENITSLDEILFSTPNREEVSYLAFYGYNDNEMFFHHDVIVLSTVLDSAYIGNSLVALATFEPDIFIYDSFTNMSVFPQQLLIGHEEPVTCLVMKDKLVSSSEDKSVIHWDLETLSICDRYKFEVSVHKFDYSSKVLAIGVENYLNVTSFENILQGENIALDYEIEGLQIINDNIYVTDCEGYMNIYDIRNLSQKIKSHKIHEDVVLDFYVTENRIITSSLDKSVKIWNDSFELQREEVHTSPVYSLAMNPYLKNKELVNEIFCGNEEDNVYPMKI